MSIAWDIFHMIFSFFLIFQFLGEGLWYQLGSDLEVFEY